MEKKEETNTERELRHEKHQELMQEHKDIKALGRRPGRSRDCKQMGFKPLLPALHSVQNNMLS